MIAAGRTVFTDRQDAARQLAEKLVRYRGQHPLVLAIPRGAVPMGELIAQRLQGDLDVVLVRKLGAPLSPELAVGAVEEGGWIYAADHAGTYGATPQYLETQAAEQLEVIRQRRARYAPGRPPVPVAGRVVIVVDDGMATGATMLAALHLIRQQKPATLVCAVPVAPPSTQERVRALVDTLVCLESPAGFEAVGQFYRHFAQVSDDEVAAILTARPAPSPAG